MTGRRVYKSLTLNYVKASDADCKTSRQPKTLILAGKIEKNVRMLTNWLDFRLIVWFVCGVHSKIARVAEWLARSAEGLGAYPEETPPAGSVRLCFLKFFLFSRAYGKEKIFGNTDS